MHVIRSLCIAFSTYSRIPVPQVAWTDENRKYSMCFFPLIGAVIGLLLWGWLALCDALGFGALLRGAVGALLPSFPPSFAYDRAAKDRVLTLISHTLMRVPVFRLECRADEEAARVCYGEIFGNGLR